jgi:hypothetical protein
MEVRSCSTIRQELFDALTWVKGATKVDGEVGGGEEEFAWRGAHRYRRDHGSAGAVVPHLWWHQLGRGCILI